MGVYIGTSELKNAYIGELLPTSVTLDKSSISLTTVGQTEQLTATVEPSDAPRKTVTWSSDNTSIATVSVSGLVTCVTPGSCNITATTVNGLTATCEVGTKWIPGVNTIAYYPLESNGDDYSGNNHNLTWTSTPTYTTSGGTKQVASLNGSIIGYIAGLGGQYSSYTFNVRCKPASASTWQNIFWNANSSGGAWEKNAYLNWNGTSYEQASKQDFGYQYRAGTGSYTNMYGTQNRTLNTRYNLCVVGNSIGVKMYVNGTQIATTSNSSTINLVSGENYVSGYYRRGNGQSGGGFNGCLSEFILEGAIWTVDDITNYYNFTKANYGLS